jgi:hypothetical protein
MPHYRGNDLCQVAKDMEKKVWDTANVFLFTDTLQTQTGDVSRKRKKECGLGFVGKYLPSYRERWLERPHVPCGRFFDVCIFRSFPCVRPLSCVLRDCCRVIVSLSCVLREFYHVYHHCQCFF